jgi:hypothetical protein
VFLADGAGAAVGSVALEVGVVGLEGPQAEMTSASCASAAGSATARQLLDGTFHGVVIAK